MIELQDEDGDKLVAKALCRGSDPGFWINCYDNTRGSASVLLTLDQAVLLAQELATFLRANVELNEGGTK